MKINCVSTRLVIAATLVLCGCAEPKEKTGVAAATGGAIGAGLGAIIGNQTGSTGQGLAIGAVAGAATGAAIGNVFDGQEQVLRTQDEAIERQQAMMRAQRAEIEELRRVSQDNISFRRPVDGRASFDSNSLGQSASAIKFESSTAKTIRESDLGAGLAIPQSAAREDSRGAVTPPPTQTAPAIVDAGNSQMHLALNTEECKKAEVESKQAVNAGENADKLFHLRRALRLCPDHPKYHNDLGEVYISLQRKQDAEFEFREALRLDSGNQQARENLGRLGIQPG